MGVAPSPVHAPPTADRHNAVLRAAHRRVEELEVRLADILQPILEQAGARAASAFTRKATHHLTAAALREADRQALLRIPPGESFGFRLRPFVLTASAPSPESAMICLKPRPDEAAALALPGGEEAEGLHVTLVYLGEVEGDLRDVLDALQPVAASHAPLEGVIGGVGRFQPPGVAILLPDVPGLVELRVAVTEALVAADVPYGRDHGYEAHISVDADPDPDTLEEALARTAQKPLHFDSIQIVRGDVLVYELALVGVPPITAAGVCTRCNGVGGLNEIGKACADGQPPVIACLCSLTAAGGGHTGWTAPAGDELIDVDHLVSTLKTKTDPVRRAFVKAAMTPTLAEAGQPFDVTNPLTAKVLAQSGSQIRNIANTTQLNVMRIIDRAYKEGLSIPDTAAAIRAGMKSASEYRARMIARTELAGAANGGSLAAAQIADNVLGIGLFKQWLTAPGAPHPRHEDYQGLDGQTVALDEPFDVGGDALQFPGDPDGDPGETINCRCALSYTETPPEGSAAAVAEPSAGGGVSDEGVSESGDTALQDAMPLTPPPGDTVSVGVAPFVPPDLVDRIKREGFDVALKDLKPTTAVGREVFAKGKDTLHLYDGGDVWHGERTLADGERITTKELHERIANFHFDGLTPVPQGEQRYLTLTAGGSGSGKGGTEIVMGDRRFSLKELEKDRELPGDQRKFKDVVLINSDSIKTMLPEFKKLVDEGDLYGASGVHEESSTLSKLIEKEARARGFNVVFDGTGSSGSLLERIESYARQDYKVDVRMTSIPTNDAIVRAMARGDHSGRYVAVDAIKDAHRGASKMLAIWKDSPLVEDWTVIDNSGIIGTPKTVVAERHGGGPIVIHDREKWDAILAKADETSTAPEVARTPTVSADQVVQRAVTEGADVPAGDVYFHGGGSDAPLNIGNPDWDKRFFITPDEKVAQHYADRHVDGAVREVRLASDARIFAPKIDPVDYTPERLGEILKYAEGHGYDAVHFGGGVGTVVLNESKVVEGGRVIVATTPQAAAAKLAAAAAAEPAVTPTLSGIAESLGGKMEGLDFRVKGQASMERKINADIADAAERGVTMTPAEAAAKINDALRYTMVFPDAEYTSGVARALAKLEADGFQQIKLKNFWGNPDYQGINGIFEKNGQRIELQFHTPMSLKVKEDQLHPLFEKYRVSTDPSESGKLWVAMEKASANVHQPVGVQALGTLERHEPPAGLVRDTATTIAPGELTAPLEALMPGALANDVTSVQAAVDDAVTRIVREKGYESADAYAAQANEALAKATADTPISIRVHPETLVAVLRDGRFKSQFETKSSSGLLDNTLRAGSERGMFGYPFDLAPADRPIYGYLTNPNSRVSPYGNIRVVLKDDVRPRATITFQDSLSGGGGGNTFLPVPLERPSIYAVDFALSGVRRDPLTLIKADEPQVTQLARMSDGFTEAQIHGGVGVGDIAEVVFPRESFLSPRGRAALEREKSVLQGYLDMPGITPEGIREWRRRVAEIDAELERDPFALAKAKLDDLGIPYRVAGSLGNVDAPDL